MSLAALLSQLAKTGQTTRHREGAWRAPPPLALSLLSAWQMQLWAVAEWLGKEQQERKALTDGGVLRQEARPEAAVVGPVVAVAVVVAVP